MGGGGQDEVTVEFPLEQLQSPEFEFPRSFMQSLLSSL